MIDFNLDKWCCGCTACASVCPVSAITMQPNSEGFMMPVVDKEKCINCGRCDRCCPHLNSSVDTGGFSLRSFDGKPSFLYFSKKKERKDSASGGFVYDAMRAVINKNGLICGCRWNDNIKAIHIVTDNEKDLHNIQSSKYVQSDMKECFKEIKSALKEGRKVLFCGTPCQTAGLNHFLGKFNNENLISICLICHGVPSPLVWEKWVRAMEVKYNGKLVNVNMRDKSYKGYKTSYSKYTFDSAFCTHGQYPMSGSHDCGKMNSAYLAESMKYVGMPTYLADPYIFLFTDNLFLRNSCYHCQYKADQNGADIIVGDFFESTPSAGNMGCSCVIAMTKKGEDYIRTLDGTIVESDFRTIGKVNPMLWTSVKENPRRQEFFYKMNITEGNFLYFINAFLPLRFKVKRYMNQIGLFDSYLKIKRKFLRID